jgi:hypothetical protein
MVAAERLSASREVQTHMRVLKVTRVMIRPVTVRAVGVHAAAPGPFLAQWGPRQATQAHPEGFCGVSIPCGELCVVLLVTLRRCQ